jgi:hypothetical protein
MSVQVKEENDPKAIYKRISRDIPVVDEYYRHYKGGIYRVIGVALNESTLQPMVIYEDVKKSGVYRFYWARNLDSWNNPEDGKTRFTKLSLLERLYAKPPWAELSFILFAIVVHYFLLLLSLS